MSGQCAIRANTFSDEPIGERCPAPAVVYRTSGEYRVHVCEAHRSGRALYVLGSQLYGCDE